MRSGRLRSLAKLVEPSGKPICNMWVGITSKEEWQEANLPPGIRSRINKTIRSHYRPDVIPGMYLFVDKTTFFIDSLRDPTGKKADLVMTCTEFVGAQGIYTPKATGQSFLLPVCPVKDAVQVGEFAISVEQRSLIEVAIIHLQGHKPIKGDVITVYDQDWIIQGVTDGGDDGIVLRLAVTKWGG